MGRNTQRNHTINNYMLEFIASVFWKELSTYKEMLTLIRSHISGALLPGLFSSPCMVILQIIQLSCGLVVKSPWASAYFIVYWRICTLWHVIGDTCCSWQMVAEVISMNSPMLTQKLLCWGKLAHKPIHKVGHQWPTHCGIKIFHDSCINVLCDVGTSLCQSCDSFETFL